MASFSGFWLPRVVGGRAGEQEVTVYTPPAWRPAAEAASAQQEWVEQTLARAGITDPERQAGQVWPLLQTLPLPLLPRRGRATALLHQLLTPASPLVAWWMETVALREALAGQRQTPEAAEVRRIWLSGEPFDLRPTTLPEMFPWRDFVPVARYLGGGRYLCGWGEHECSVYGGPDVAAAFDQCRRWYSTTRTNLLQTWHAQARQQLQRRDPVVATLWQRRLTQVGELALANGLPVVRRSQVAYDPYYWAMLPASSVCLGPAVEVAVTFYAHVLDQQDQPGEILAASQVIRLLAPADWRRTEGGYAWDTPGGGGEIQIRTTPPSGPRHAGQWHLVLPDEAALGDGLLYDGQNQRRYALALPSDVLADVPAGVLPRAALPPPLWQELLAVWAAERLRLDRAPLREFPGAPSPQPPRSLGAPGPAPVTEGEFHDAWRNFDVAAALRAEQEEERLWLAAGLAAPPRRSPAGAAESGAQREETAPAWDETAPPLAPRPDSAEIAGPGWDETVRRVRRGGRRTDPGNDVVEDRTDG